MLEGIPVATLTPPAVLMLVVVLILLGRIVPRQTLMDKTKEAEKWQKAYEAEREARALSNSQTVELLEVTRTTYHLLQVIFHNSERISQSGEPDAISKPQT